MSADRSQAQLVSAVPGDEEAPDWSPDGTKIVFTSGSKAHSNIFVMNADGNGRASDLTKDANRNRSPDWSSTNKIVFSSNAGGSPDIFVMDAGGSRPQRLTHGPASDGAPAWSPDASQIAFPRKQGGQSHIFVMNADGSSLRQVTFGAVVDTSPSWSPSGASLAFSRGQGNLKLDVFVLHLGQGSPRRLNLGPGNNFDPAWRP
jgi:TolB protein